MEIEIITARIAAEPDNAGHYIGRGKLHYRNSDFGSALNDFLKARELAPDSVEAAQFISLINEILDFRYTDIYNP